MVRSMHTIMNCVVMKVGGTEGIPKTGSAKPFITTTDILCSGRIFILFLDHDSHGLIDLIANKGIIQISCVHDFQGIFSFLGLKENGIFLENDLFRLLQSHGEGRGNQGRRNLMDVSFWK